MLYKNPFHGFSHTWHILMGIPVPHSLGGRTMKIVLFGFHVNRVRSVIQRMPDMLAHIWGELKNVPYPLEEDCNDDFKPLRGYYRIDDGTIDLVSPFVPDDAEWKVDGVAVYNKRIPIKDLVPGKHEITFTSARCSGKVVVSVLY